MIWKYFPYPQTTYALSSDYDTSPRPLSTFVKCGWNKWQPHASFDGTCSHRAWLSKGLPMWGPTNSDDDGNNNNNKCQHLMFDDRFFPVVISITVRSLSSPAREQSHGVRRHRLCQSNWFGSLLRERTRIANSLCVTGCNSSCKRFLLKMSKSLKEF